MASKNGAFPRSNSLPTIFYVSSDEEDDESDSEEDYTEETDGSSQMSPYFTVAPSVFLDGRPNEVQVGDVMQLDGEGTHSGITDESVDDGSEVKSKPRWLILQPSESGNFSFINASPCDSHVTPSPSIYGSRRPPTVSALAGCRTSSCLNFYELSKKNEARKTLKIKPWNHKKPNLHKVKSAKKLQKLLESPLADPNGKDSKGDAPIHVYINEGKKYRKELLVALLSGGADVNLLDADGNTPLHLAVKRDDLLSVKILIVFGASLKDVDSHRQIPSDQITNGSSPEVAQLLETLLADPGFIHRSRVPTISSPGAHCTHDMIGYRLACRRETQLALDIENRIKDMLHKQELKDPDEAGAAFLQWNHLLKWRQTKRKHVQPGSRVLFLDGGGIRGLVLIEILIQLEERTGQKITELFDWIVGTSTGGIVALCLVYAGLSLSQIRGLFFQFSELVFKEGLFGIWPQAISNSLTMQGILQDVFKDKMMFDRSKPKVLICAVNIKSSALPVEFFNNVEERGSHLTNIPVWKVARMTSAAPLYFTDYQGYIDGGIKANNPCEFAMEKIREYYKNIGMPLPHFPIIVSVGTGIFPSQKLDNLSVSISYGLDSLVTVRDLFNLLIHVINRSEEESKHFSNWCHNMKPEILFFRFNPNFRAEIRPTETNIDLLIEMVVETKEYMILPDALTDMFNVAEIFRELEDF